MKIALEGGGSQKGLDAIRNNHADIGLSSFGFNLDSLMGNDHEVIEEIMAYDGIVLINNEHNPVRKLTNQQVAEIYTGEISDWSQLGGKQGTIEPIARDENSGTQKLFTTYFGIDKLSEVTLIAHENVEIVSQVIQNPNAIGFVGFAYFSIGVNDILIPAKNGVDTTDYVLPTHHTITRNIYPLRRSLRMYYKQKTENPGMNAFLTYLKTKRAISVIESFEVLTEPDSRLVTLSQVK